MKRMKRVLHILPNFGPGGAERLVVDLMGVMDGGRFEVAAVSLFPESGTILEQEARNRGLKVYFLNKRIGPDPKVIPSLYGVIRRFRPDVVHTHRYVLRYALPATLAGRVPVIVHTLHNIAEKEVDGVGRRVHWFAFRFLRVVPVAISEQVARTAKKLYGSHLRIPVIYNGIPTERFVLSKGPESKGVHKVIVLHIGRFSPQKNHSLLLEAFSRALNHLSTMELWLVGEGPLRSEIQNQVYARGLEKNVRFWGLRSDIPELLAEADVVVLASDWEGVPLVVLEAMASGKPVVATAVGGVPELVEHGKTGFLIPPRDPQALAESLLHLAQNAELRREMGEAGRGRAVEHFDIRRTAEAYAELYEELLSAWRKK